MAKPSEGELVQFEVIDKSLPIRPNKTGDWFNFILLIVLYTIQGLPHGVGISLPFILQNKKDVTFADQAYFSMFLWPFSLKLLWAPIVDSFYVQRIGRRKSWFIPLQYLMGMLWFYIAYNVDWWLPESEKPNIKALTWSLFLLIFLSATQDVAVDGWGITIMGKNNSAHASTCNSIGYVLGDLIGCVCTTILTSEEFCNQYLRKTQEPGGIITIKGFLYFLSFTLILFTTLVGIFKKEDKTDSDDGSVKINVIQNYKLLLDILKLPCVRELAIILITMQIGFSADNAFQLKLIDAGVKQDDLMLMKTLLLIPGLFIPFGVSKFTSGPKPISAYLNMMPFRLMWNLTFVMLVYYTPILIKTNGVVQVPIYYYLILGLISAIHEIQFWSMQTFIMGFFSRISDARIGGTYMTTLNTLFNIGKLMLKTLALKMIDLLTYGKYSSDTPTNNSTSSLTNMRKIKNDDYKVTINGYYIVVILLMVIGFVWYFFFKTRLRNLQSMSLSSWLVVHDNQNKEETTNGFIT